MKTWLRILLIPIFTVSFIVACGKKGDNNNANNPFGYNTDPFGSYGVVSKGNTYVGRMSINSKSDYRDYLDEIGKCYDSKYGIFNSCRQIDGQPRVAISFDDTVFNTNLSVNGRMILDIVGDYGNQIGSQPYNGRFYQVDNNSAIEANINGITGTPSYNNPIRLLISGTLTGEMITLTLYFKNKVLGTASLEKIPKVQYPQQPYGYGGGYGGYQQPYGGGYQQPYGGYQQPYGGYQQPYGYRPYGY